MDSTSQKVIRRSECDIGQLILAGSRVELEEVELHKLVNFHHCGFVTTSVAVIRSREDCDYVSFMGPVVSVHDKLMSSGYTHKAIGVVKLLRDVLSK